MRDMILLKVIYSDTGQQLPSAIEVGGSWDIYRRLMIMILLIAIGSQTILFVVGWMSRHTFVGVYIFDSGLHSLLTRWRG